MKKTRLMILAMAMMLLLPQALFAAEGEQPLRVASLTKMSGNFTTNLWGNNTADTDMRLLLHGYPTVYENVGKGYMLNDTAMRHLDTKEEANGNKTFTFTLQDGLTFNDGSPITARDYVFSVLLQSSPFITQLGGSSLLLAHLEGAEAYAANPQAAYSGIRLISDTAFSMTVTADNFPHPQELSFVDVQPYPVSVLAPGSEVVDEGKGAFLKGNWSVEVLQKSLLDPVDGYLSHPWVTSGPYSLVSYDFEEGTAVLALNPRFKGDPYGQKPSIPALSFTFIRNQEIVTQLQAGQMDLINKVTANSVITKAKAENLNMIDYPREGLAALTIATERPLVSLLGVRKAIIRSLDIDRLVADFLGDRGQHVIGIYGQGIALDPTWLSTIRFIPRYYFSRDLAISDLISEGFVLNQEGKDFDPQVDTLRHRLTDPGKAFNISSNPLIPLILNIGITPENEAANLVVEQLEQSLPQIGAQLNVNMLTMPQLLQQFYRQTERESDLYFLGSNFMKDFAGTSSGYAVEAFDQGNNPSAFKDEQLAELTRKLRDVPPGNLFQYQQAWLAYQTRLAETLPVIPLYTNTYADLYTDQSGLNNYAPQNYWSWAEAILYATR